MKNLDNDKILLEKMISIYCINKHNSSGKLCLECEELKEYAFYRLSKCPFGDKKKSCGFCKIKCYDEEHKKMIKEVMKFSGWRVMLTHPIMTLKHI